MLYQSAKPVEPPYSDVYRFFKEGRVVEYTIEGNVLTARLDDETVIQYTIPYMSIFIEDLGATIRDQLDTGKIRYANYIEGFETPWWMMFIPYLVVIVIFVLLWYFLFNRSGVGGGGGANTAMKFGRARTRLGTDEKKKVTFADVAGAEEEKYELQEIVDFLKNPKRYIEIGARIPKGVLLVGPPGTGKTYLAKAVAGEAGVQFLSISGSDFVELYVGVGASRVRDLFEQAKKVAPSIIFIDEIDAVGRQRGAGMGGGHDEREQTLNQLLVEMDGFGNNEGVIVMAATNRQDILDPALMRPGRFDRQVYVGLPDVRGREAVLKIHSRGKPLDAGVNLEIVAKTTGGFSPADLENLLNEAALLAVRQGRRVIKMEDMEEAMIKVIAGPAKKSRVISDKERRLTAYHESGHAIVMKNLEHHDPVHQISIIPRGAAGGMTISLPNEDKFFMSKSEMFERIISLLGGRVAEKLVLDDISSGASNDIQRATDIARRMVTRYGMSDEIGPIAFGSEHDEVFLGRDLASTRNYSEDVAAKIDREIKKIIDRAYSRCEEILRREIDKLHAVAEYLLEYETMDADTFERYFLTGSFENTDEYEEYKLPNF
ncbi:MAG: ATP-dependent zinc metalloprotease FtsH [Clostridiales bacterium]|nr:ATP-dependent zinc metalloprotease FtsH [Clostridiales bacterium]